MLYSTLREERKLWRRGCKRIACLDEAGRGPLAGPVTAAAVTIRKFPISNFKFPKIKDSKQLTSKRREELYKILTKHPNIKWGIGRVSEKVIDKINILEATRLAMTRALISLEKKNKTKRSSRIKTRDRGFLSAVDFLILDGNFKIDLPIPQKSIIKADEKVFSCAVASIIAKVTRDKIMKGYHQRYPKYGFDRHKGYPTKFHRKILKKYGPSIIHRKSFAPIKEWYNKQKIKI